MYYVKEVSYPDGKCKIKTLISSECLGLCISLAFSFYNEHLTKSNNFLPPMREFAIRVYDGNTIVTEFAFSTSLVNQEKPCH